MPGLTQTALAARAGIKQPSVHRAVRRGRLLAGDDGLIDPDERHNAEWLRLHVEGFDSAGRALAANHHRPVVAPAEARNGRPSDPSGRNGGSAGSAAAHDNGGLDLAQLAAELRLDELSPRPAIDREPQRLPVSGGALLDIPRLIDNLAKVVADSLNREGELLVAVLNGIDERLVALERRVASNDGAEILARLATLAEGLTGVPAGIAELGGQAEGTRHRLDVIAEQIRRLIEVLARYAERR
jgi:hypothetical protein